MNPLLSIVIPTKDRYKYLKHLINLIDSFQFDEIELVLQDNTANNSEIIGFLSQKKYPYIKYFHEPKQISVSYNSDLAILNSSGEYVCFIGDDDGVTKNILDCVKWMRENEIEALVPTEVKYIWQDYIKGKGGVNLTDVLILKNKGEFSNDAKIINSLETLNVLIKKGCLNRGKLPLVYHGIVQRSILNKIYDIGGTFFPGASPDIANGVALSFFVEKYVRLDFPIIISGQSKMHGGGIRKIKDRLADIDQIPFLPLNAKEQWEKTIPKVWTGETVWPESAIKAMRYMGRIDLVKKVNYNRILVSFIFSHPKYFYLAMNKIRNPFMFGFWFIIEFSEKLFNAVKRRIKLYFFKEPIISGIKIYGLGDIQKASEYIYFNNSFKPNFKN